MSTFLLLFLHIFHIFGGGKLLTINDVYKM